MGEESKAINVESGGWMALPSSPRWVDVLVSLLPALLGLCLLIAFGVSVLVPVVHYGAAGNFSWLGGAAIYAVFWGVVFWAVRRATEVSEARVVWRLIGLSALVKLVLIGVMRHLPLHADQALFHLFMREMADSRLYAGTMAELSRYYDYPLWSGRGMPFHFLARLWAGDLDVLWMRLVNVALSSGILAVTYGFSRRLLPEGARKWAVFLLMALPFQTMVTTDYSHHLFASFYLLLSMWCAWELVWIAHSWRVRAGLSAVTGVCLMLMMWQRGTHWIAMGVWLAVVVWTAFARGGWRRAAWLGAGLVVMPLLISIPLARHFDGWLAQHDEHRLSTLLPGFAARGWCPESQGEYCARYERLEGATPWPDKVPAVVRLITSQIRENPGVVCGWFPVMKTGKLFLAGYASNFEEGLAGWRPQYLAWARGVRLLGAPLFLGFALWGCWCLTARARDHAKWLLVALVPVVTWAAYIFFGETSPRYSIFFQPFLALVGAAGFARWERRACWRATVWRVAWRNAAVTGIVALGLMALVLAVHALPGHRQYANLETGWGASAAAESALEVQRGSLRPFEARLKSSLVASDGAAVQWALPERPLEDGDLSLYVIGANAAARRMRLVVMPEGGASVSVELRAISYPHWVRLSLPAEARNVAFQLVPFEDGEVAGASVELGYMCVMDSSE